MFCVLLFCFLVASGSRGSLRKRSVRASDILLIGFPLSRGRVNERRTQWAWFKCTNQHLSKDEPWLLSSSMSVGLINHFPCITLSIRRWPERGGRLSEDGPCQWLLTPGRALLSSSSFDLGAVGAHQQCSVTHRRAQPAEAKGTRQLLYKEADFLPFNAAEAYQ